MIEVVHEVCTIPRRCHPSRSLVEPANLSELADVAPGGERPISPDGNVRLVKRSAVSEHIPEVLGASANIQ